MVQEPDPEPGLPCTTTSVELDADLGLVVVKRSAGGSAAPRIQRELQVLSAARHPGVVDLVASADPDGVPAVVTRWVGPTTLDALGSVELRHAAAIMAALASSVADLHDLGIVHGAIGAEHVILAPDGRPVLSGFGRAHVLTRDHTAGRPAPEDDVGALACLLRKLTGEDVDLEPIPDRRGWRRKPRWQGYQRRALLTLADQATHDDVGLRPTARALAATIHDTIPEARLTPLSPVPDMSSGRLPGPTPRGATVPGDRQPAERPGAPVELRPVDAGTADADPAAAPPPIEVVGDDVLAITGQPVPSRPQAPDAPGALRTTDEGSAGSAGDVPQDAPPPATAASAPAQPHGSAIPRRPPGGSVRIGAVPIERPVADSTTPKVRRTLTALAGGVGIVLLLLGVHDLGGRRGQARTFAAHAVAPASGGARVGAAPAGPSQPARQAAAPHRRPSRQPALPRLPSPSCRRRAQGGVDLDGDHCPDPVLVAGTTVVARGVRYGIGRPHDRIALGDWDCDGRATPALLRPASGEIFVFQRWAVRGTAVTVHATTRVPGAVGLEAAPRPGGAGCAQLRVRTASGRRVVISTRPAP